MRVTWSRPECQSHQEQEKAIRVAKMLIVLSWLCLQRVPECCPRTVGAILCEGDSKKLVEKRRRLSMTNVDETTSRRGMRVFPSFSQKGFCCLCASRSSGATPALLTNSSLLRPSFISYHLQSPLIQFSCTPTMY